MIAKFYKNSVQKRDLLKLRFSEICDELGIKLTAGEVNSIIEDSMLMSHPEWEMLEALEPHVMNKVQDLRKPILELFKSITGGRGNFEEFEKSLLTYAYENLNDFIIPKDYTKVIDLYRKYEKIWKDVPKFRRFRKQFSELRHKLSGDVFDGLSYELKFHDIEERIFKHTSRKFKLPNSELYTLIYNNPENFIKIISNLNYTPHIKYKLNSYKSPKYWNLKEWSVEELIINLIFEHFDNQKLIKDLEEALSRSYDIIKLFKIYNLFQYWKEDEIVDYCRKEGIKLESYLTKIDLIKQISEADLDSVPRHPYIMELLERDIIVKGYFSSESIEKYQLEKDQESYMEIEEYFLTTEDILLRFEGKVVSVRPEVDTLDLSNLNIKNIADIQNLRKLKKLKILHLDNNDISEINGLEVLPKLSELYLSYNKIFRISGLEKLKRLEVLDLSDNIIEEIEGLENLERLNTLDLSNNKITEIKGLESVGKLAAIDLRDNPIPETDDFFVKRKKNNLNFYGTAYVVVDYCREKKAEKSVSIPESELKTRIDDPHDVIDVIEIKEFDEFEQIERKNPLKVKQPKKEITKMEAVFKEVGYLGEYIVYSEILPKEFKDKYPGAEMVKTEVGFNLERTGSIIASVIWNNIEKESGLSYDFKVIDKEKENFIEVKASTSEDKTFIISCNELEFAKKKGEFYTLYQIIDVNNIKICKYRKYKNFYKKYQSGEFERAAITLRSKNLNRKEIS